MTRTRSEPGPIRCPVWRKAIRFGAAATLLAVLGACGLQPGGLCVDSGNIGGPPSVVSCGSKYELFDRDDRGR